MKRRELIASMGTLAFAEKSKNIIIKKLILVAGAHPDDPETGAGGAIAKWISDGHKVIVFYLTTGEAGIPGTKNEAAAKIRKEEAIKACKLLGAEPYFAGQIDGNTIVNSEWYKKIADYIALKKPDLIVTHWPLDSHRDHRACGILIEDAWQNAGMKQPFYYFEVMSGVQSHNFQPTDFVNITNKIDIKHKSCFIHKSQKIEESYPNDHAKMEVFRGIESGCDFAEGYIKHSRSINSDLFF